MGSIPGSGRSPEGGLSNPLQYTCLENPMDRGAWCAVIHGVTKSWTQLSDWTDWLILFQILFWLLQAGWLKTTETYSLTVLEDSVQSLSHVQLFATPWTTARQASLSSIISWSLLKLMSIESVMPSNRLLLYHPLLFLPSIYPSIRVFSNELVLCIRCAKYGSFSISSSNEYSGLICFRIDSFDLPAVQEALKSLVQHHSLKSRQHIKKQRCQFADKSPHIQAFYKFIL